MNTDKHRTYNREWMRDWRKNNPELEEEQRKKNKERRLLRKESETLSSGHCPHCSMLLNPEFEGFHRGCPYYETKIHAQKIDLLREKA